MIIQKVKSFGRTYKVYNGTFYNKDTSDDVVMLLDNLKQGGKRVEFGFGNAKTGKDWGETNDISGTIGRSTGQVKIPLLIHNKRSMGGGGLLTNCIVRIRESKGKRIIYQHKNYHLENKIKKMAGL